MQPGPLGPTWLQPTHAGDPALRSTQLLKIEVRRVPKKLLDQSSRDLPSCEQRSLERPTRGHEVTLIADVGEVIEPTRALREHVGTQSKRQAEVGAGQA